MQLKKELYCDDSSLPIRNHDEALIEWFTFYKEDESSDIHLVLKEYSHGVKNDVMRIGDLKLNAQSPDELYAELLELKENKPLNPNSYEDIISRLFEKIST